MRVEDLTKFEGECPNIVVFGTYMDIRVPLTKKWKKIINERGDKKIRQAEAEKKIMLCVFDYGLSTDNVIYYSHTNTLSFNWNGYGEKITQEEFDDFVNKVDRSQLPEGIKFELK